MTAEQTKEVKREIEKLFYLIMNKFLKNNCN
jgi:hypothetical protein